MKQTENHNHLGSSICVPILSGISDMLLLTNVILTLWVSWSYGQEISCGPPHIPNGFHAPERAIYRLKDVITYRCHDGFYPSIRGITAKCTGRGWEPPPRCSLKPCDMPEIEHGVLYKENTYKSYFPTSVDDWYYYSCDDNYVTPTEAYWYYVTCKPEGWLPEVPCLRKCLFKYLEHGHSPHKGKSFLQGESVKVNCNCGYSLQNHQNTVTCTENGWSPPLKCFKHCDMPVFENATAIITGTQFRANDKLDYQCLDGYESKDGKTKGSIVCGENGWSHVPICFKSAEMCGPPPIIRNGDITTFPLPVYPPWSRVDYQCQAYYRLWGPKYITCSNAKWSDPPRCMDPCIISKENLNKNNIQVKGKDHTTYYVKTGDIIEFKCKLGHIAVTAEQSFQTKCHEGRVEFPRCK